MDADAYPQEVLADEEPRYLRRQKPLEIKRRKFGRKAWKAYLRVSVWAGVGLAGVWTCYATGQFLLTSKSMALIHPEQVEISGNHYVTRSSILEFFAVDRRRSVLRIPLDRRRHEIESIPWVERAVVRRALPNKIEIDIVERTPIAYLRQGSGLSLVDSHGVILDAPVGGSFHFPVVMGLTPEMAADDREQRMELFAGFSQQLELARAGAMDQVSEVDVSDVDDLRATIAGLQDGGQTPNAPLLVHFGNSDFGSKYLNLVQNVGKWRATAGSLDSVDLRFDGEAIANPEMSAAVHRQAAQAQKKRGTATRRR